MIPGRQQQLARPSSNSLNFTPPPPPQLLPLLDFHTRHAEGLQVRGDASSLVEVVARDGAVAALVLQGEGAEAIKLAGEVVDLSFQLAVGGAEVAAFRLDGLDVFALPRAAFGGRELVLLAESLRVALGGGRAG